MRRINVLFAFLLFILCFSHCTSDSEVIEPTVNTTNQKIYQLKSSNNTGIDFNNQITETEEINTITYDGMLQGAGVGILDYNNDGLPDIYFAGNMTSDKLYKNLGGLKFEDVSGIIPQTENTWSTGVSIADINGDGYDDIYVCKFLYDNSEQRANHLYINNKNGGFEEKADEYGLGDRGYSIMANFFDMDNDGDLDVYVANQPPNSLEAKNALKGKTDLSFTDRMYENIDNRYVDITNQNRMSGYNYSLSTTAADINNDGLTDLFVACDYEEPDLLWVNQGNKRFLNKAQSSFKHLSNFSMGADIADVNNDGHLDIFCVDMVAEDNFRQKTNMSGMNPEKFWSLVKGGYHFQYMFNALHLNNGNASFSEVAQMAGISNTDWSWTPLFIDMDNDGLKDLLVTNGIIKEMRNKDYEIWRKAYIKEKEKEMVSKGLREMKLNPLTIAEKAPSHKIANYLYQNQGNLKFENRQQEWGFEKAGWSQGAAYADFDNDGDLDVVINNMNSIADLYENTSSDISLNNFIAIELEGYGKNTKGFNARIEIQVGKKKQIIDYSPFRGYMSTSENIAHFGLGGHKTVNSITVDFPDQRRAVLKNVEANQTIVIKHSEAKETRKFETKNQEVFKKENIVVNHFENDFDDYKREILIPYKMSSLGPHIAVGDVNNDGHEDFYISGSIGIAGQLMLGNGQGFVASNQATFQADNRHEDSGAAFGDIDGDGDLDLYVCSGGNEYNMEPNTPAYQDRLYINNGQGEFTKSNKLPYIDQSTSAISFMDFDKDGDMDLFIGGRQIPAKYGVPATSLILEQVNGKFQNVTATKGKSFIDVGMLTDSKWVDIDNDGENELITAGEWMPISMYQYNGSEFVKKESQSLSNTKGMWNTIKVADVDSDGKLDIIAGNLGLNNKYKASVNQPFKIFVNDFDQNGSHDVYLGSYDSEGNCYPVRGRQCSSEQMPFVKDKYESYTKFATATIEDVLDGKMEGGFSNECQTFAHTIFYNSGGGNFEEYQFPRTGQLSPTFGIVISDLNSDGKSDILLTGNYYDREVETTRSDAGIGQIFLQSKDRKFSKAPNIDYGIFADKDARGAVEIKSKTGKNIIAVANNNSGMQFYSRPK